MNGLLNFAGKYKFLSYFSCLLSGLSALIAILPFWYIWNILSCVIFSEGKELIPAYAWQSVMYAVISILIYIAVLLCSHTAAFRIADNIRAKISSLPHELIDSIESYIAHIMPDSYSALFSSFGLACLLFRSDWRLALV
ncbi:MAG: ABC transporter ATP-binding protein, partial [Synergistaceae bacterium]|nr:ABC transporter ATP-binding protein [Synergistaceae bacterium]